MSNISSLALLGLVLLSVASVPAAAQTVAPQPTTPPVVQNQRIPRFITRFNAANTTHDGKLTLEQARAAHMEYVVRNFNAIDTQHQGYVTLADLQAYRQRVHAARGSTQPAQPSPQQD